MHKFWHRLLIKLRLKAPSPSLTEHQKECIRITREALTILENDLCFSEKIDRTITIKRPDRFGNDHA
jgi:hypothetical protein